MTIKKSDSTRLPDGAAALAETGGNSYSPMSNVLDLLWNAKVPDGLFDPWNEQNADDAGPDSLRQRRLMLAAHLSAPEPTLLMVGEAPGYRGCRMSGIAFVSERQLVGGTIPRAHTSGRLSSKECRRLTWWEGSAAVVWEGLRTVGAHQPARTILWNAVPWHPYNAHPLSNRPLSQMEREAGRPILDALLQALPRNIAIGAVGRVAEASLKDKVPRVSYVCHPAARGGRARFAEDLRRALDAS